MQSMDDISWEADIQVETAPDGPDTTILPEEWRDALESGGQGVQETDARTRRYLPQHPQRFSSGVPVRVPAGQRTAGPSPPWGPATPRGTTRATSSPTSPTP